jgi:hypothetical protein
LYIHFPWRDLRRGLVVLPHLSSPLDKHPTRSEGARLATTPGRHSRGGGDAEGSLARRAPSPPIG